MVEPTGPSPGATEAPTLDTDAAGSDGTAPPPAPGLADNDLEHLDHDLNVPSPASSPDVDDGTGEGDSEEAAAIGGGEGRMPTDGAEANDEPMLSELTAGHEPTGGVPPTEVTPTAEEPMRAEPTSGSEPGEAAPDDSAVQNEVTAAAQGEVEEASAEGPEPATGGGGGEAGGAIEDTPAPVLPELSSAPPESAMASLVTLGPTQMAATVSGVQSAASRAVGHEQARLAAAPPRHTPLAGATVATPTSELVPGSGATSTARGVQIAPGQPQPQPGPAPLPAPARPTVDGVRAPQLTAAPQGELTQDLARDFATSIARLPVRDPGVQTSPGPSPQLRLAGDAEPGQVGAQQAHLLQCAAHARGEGIRDAAEPLGEDAVRPTTPVETLEAEEMVASPGGEGAGSTAPVAGEPAEGDGDANGAAVNAVAEEQQGRALRSAASSAAGSMSASRQQHADQERAQRQESAQQIASMEQEHAQAEREERTNVRTEVANQRSQWRTEQQILVVRAHAEAAVATTQAGQTIDAERAQAQTEAAAAHAKGAQEATQARQEGEREAARQRAEAQQESGGGGFLGWIATRATALFDRVKQGISAAFERARQAVRAAIERAQQLATAVIERARQAVVAAIKAAGTVLTAIGDRLLAGFPALRDKFRNAIRATVRRAESIVNRLAEGLKAGVRAALGLLGRALAAALSGLEAGLKATVDSVAAAVRGAISAARAALQALGAFMAIAQDVAASPGAWLRKLAAAVIDGLRNHLWQALKTAVQQWFNDKVEQVLGLGRAVWNLLTRGGISLARIGRMAWEGIKQAIPAALIGLLVEKLASMIIPAAGAVLAIIQGLQAAWGAVSRILQAIDRFITFLKAVKSGTAGPAFAQAVAAAGVAVVDFVSNWLLARLARGASAVAGRIRAIAQRIGAALRRVIGRLGGALRGLRGRIGQRLRGMRDRFRTGRNRRRDRRDRSASREDRRRAAMDRAKAELPTRIEALLARGISRARLWVTLRAWQLQYRLRRLAVQSEGDRSKVVAANSPQVDLVTAILTTKGQILTQVLHRVSDDVMRDPEIRRLAAEIMEQREAGRGTSASPIMAPHGLGPAAADVRALGQIGSPPPHWARQIITPEEYKASSAAAGSDRRAGRVPTPPQGAEFYQLGSGGPTVRESAIAGPLGENHPGHTVVDVEGGKYMWMGRARPSDPQAFMTAMFHLEANEPVPSEIMARLSSGEFQRAGGMARLSQLEGGRFGAGPASIRLGTFLGTVTPPGHTQPLRNWRDRTDYKRQPETAWGALDVGPHVQERLGFQPVPGVGPPTSNVTPSMETKITTWLTAQLGLVEDWLKIQVLTDPKLFHSLEKLEAYVERDLRGHLRAILFARRISSPSESRAESDR